MLQAPTPANERARLQALQALGLLDTPAEERFDRLTRLAQQIMQVPIALISLIDAQRQWFKSSQGLEARETSRDMSFCGHTILGADVFIVADAAADVRFADNPLVTQAPHIRFYAGAPLTLRNGLCVGTLCAIDHQPRHISPGQLAALRDLAQCVVDELEREQRQQSATEQALIQARLTHDVTERRRVAQMKTEFISTVSHELRTPLTTINGALGLLCGGALGAVTEQAQTMLDIAHKNCQQLTLLINDLLDMEKLAASKMRFELRAQPLIPLVEQCLQSMRDYAQQYQVTLVLTQQAAGVRVQVDGSRLQQVLSNLLSNAAKFSPQGGQIEVAVHQDNSTVRIEVTDHGPGIPAAYKSRIFHQFSQADSSDSRQKGGTGLGLAISKELIERMHGTIGFESQEGCGACFYVELPVIPETTPTTVQP